MTPMSVHNVKTRRSGCVGGKEMHVVDESKRTKGSFDGTDMTKGFFFFFFKLFSLKQERERTVFGTKINIERKRQK